MRPERSKEDYRTIVKALKYKVLALDQQVKSVRLKNKELQLLASPLELKTAADVKRLRDRLSHMLGVQGMTYTDYFKLFDYEFRQAINKKDVTNEDFKQFLNLIKPSQTISYSQFKLAVEKLGVMQGRSLKNDCYVAIARKIKGQFGIKDFWAKIQQNKRISLTLLSKELTEIAYPLLDILCFEQKIMENDGFMDYELFQYRVNQLANEELNIDAGEFISVRLMKIQSESQDAEPKQLDFLNGFGLLDERLGKSQQRQKFYVRRVRSEQNTRNILALLAKKKITLCTIFELVLDNLPDDNKSGVITDHAFMKCMRTGGLRGFSAINQSSFFQAIDSQVKGYICYQEMFAFLVQNRSSEDIVDVGIRLLLQSILQLGGLPIEQIISLLMQHDGELIDVQELTGMAGIKANLIFFQSVQMFMIWLMELDRKKSKAKELPEKIGCSPGFILKKLKKRLQDKQYEQSDNQSCKIADNRTRLTTTLQIIDVENDLKNAIVQNA